MDILHAVKCDNCGEEMTELKDFFELKLTSLNFFTIYSQHNIRNPNYVKHFCNGTKCISEWASKQKS